MAAEDYLDMPTLVENNIMVALPEKVREFYEALEDDLLGSIDNKTIVADNAAVASGKCRQVANGGIYLTPDLEITGFKLPKQKREWLNLHYEKVDALADLIEELQGSPLLVAYDFEHDMDRIREKLGMDVPYIGGGVSTKRSIELEGLWNAGKLPVLFGHPQSMAHGLNLQEVGNHVCWHSLTWDFELYDQFIRRVRRQGNKSKRVFVHHILAEDTIDKTILYALKSKNRGQQALFKALQDLAKVKRRR
jgi:SNF2 family DNA or RNA helicase